MGSSSSSRVSMAILGDALISDAASTRAPSGKVVVFVSFLTGLAGAMLFMRGGGEQQLDFEGADSMFARPMASMYRPRIFGRPDPRITYQGCPVITRAEVKLGSDSGGLAFVPDSLTVKSGEEVKFVNNA